MTWVRIRRLGSWKMLPFIRGAVGHNPLPFSEQFDIGVWVFGQVSGVDQSEARDAFVHPEFEDFLRKRMY